MLQAITDNFEAIVAIFGAIVAIVHIWSKIIAERRESGKWDLEKTMQAVGATQAELKKLKDEGHIEDAKEIGEKAIELVEKYRNKKLSTTMKGKTATMAVANLELMKKLD